MVALMLLHSLASIANLTALWRKNYEIFEVLRAGVEPGRPAVVKPEPVVVDSDDEKAPTQPTQANKSVDKTTAAGQASKMTAVKQIASKMPPLPPMAPPPQSNEMMAAQLAALQQKYAALLAQVHGDGPASLPRSDSDSSLFHTPQVARSLFTPERVRRVLHPPLFLQIAQQMPDLPSWPRHLPQRLSRKLLRNQNLPLSLRLQHLLQRRLPYLHALRSLQWSKALRRPLHCAARLRHPLLRNPTAMRKLPRQLIQGSLKTRMWRCARLKQVWRRSSTCPPRRSLIITGHFL